MNTRLQVEHPVTEFVTGIDLVKAQLRIAYGEKLPWQQSDIQQTGWAIECRICAEDPLSNFFPSTGHISHLRTPSGPGVRDDRGFTEGSDITLYYDSLLAKLITYGSNRTEAIARMKRALEEYHIVGVKTTIPFLECLMSHPVFVAGDYNTGFVEHELNLHQLTSNRTDTLKLVAIAAALYSKENRSVGENKLAKKSTVGTNTNANNWKMTGRLHQIRNGL
jgi:acetyl-CoA carboxylase, biotin carboxylase subunit